MSKRVAPLQLSIDDDTNAQFDISNASKLNGRQASLSLMTIDQNSIHNNALSPGYSNASDESIQSENISELVHDNELEIKTKLIRITRSFRTRWDLFTMLLSIYNCFTVPFFVAFRPDTGMTFEIANTIIDFIFMIDIVLNFFTTYVNRNGEEVIDMKMIAQKYLKGLFWLDLTASIPIDNFIVLFGETNTHTEIMQLSDLLKLTRILRLGRIIRFTRARDDIKATLKLMQLTLYLIMWVHLTGCIWFLMIRGDEEWVPVPDFVTGVTDLYDRDIWMQYFTAFYHAVWLLVGGEVGPRNTLEAFVASILYIIGALITAVLFGEMAVLMSNLSRRQTQFQKILDGALTTMNNMELPIDLTNRILDYITQTQSSQSAQDEYHTFQSSISPSLQQEVSACIYDPIISKNEVLQGQSELTKALVHRLDNEFTQPENEIISENTDSQCLYFLVLGECKVIVTDNYRNKHDVCYLYPGAHFGEIGLIYNTYRTATVIGLGYCTVARLQKKDFEFLVSNYKGFIDKLKK